MEENNGKIRLIEIDYVKAITIIGMICMHVYENLCDFNALNEITASGKFVLGRILEFANSNVGASMFMFCMGVGIVFSLHNSTSSMIKRGIKLFIIGIILNICTNIIPSLVLSLFNIKEPFSEPIIYLILECEILGFAGLALITIALFKKANINNCIMLMIAILLQIVSDKLTNVNCPNDFITILLGQFVPTCKNSYFPLFNWLIFPIAGMVFGDFIKTIVDRRKEFYAYCVPLGLIVYIATIYSLKQLGVNPFVDMYSLVDNKSYYVLFISSFIAIVMTLVQIGVFYFVSELLKNNKAINEFIMYLSKNLNRFYIGQWLIIPSIYIIMRIMGHNFLDPQYIIIMTIIIFIIDFVVIKMMDKLFTRQ